MNGDIQTSRLRTSRMRFDRWLLSLYIVCVIPVTTSCGDPTRVSFLIEPEERLQSLEVNHPAVNLALIAPYDTVTLSAIARNALGEELPDTIPVRFTTTATQLAVSPAGVVRALAQTSPSGVSVTISATYRGVTQIATTQVVVTSVASPPQMDSFSFARSFTDTLDIGPTTGFGKPATTLFPRAKTATGSVISRVVYAYQSSNRAAVSVSSTPAVWATTTGQISLVPGNHIGETSVIVAKARVYGVAMCDSVVVRRAIQWPDFASVLLFDTMTVSPPEIELARGGDVYWINSSAHHEIGITFDLADSVKAPSRETTAALIFWGWLPDSGDIAPFMRDTVASPGDAIPNPPHKTMVRGRSFPIPGRYHWRTTRSPMVEGTIVVR